MENQSLNVERSARLLNVAIRQPIFVIAIVAVVTGLGLYLNWPTVVALGLAPLILTFAPCMLMCAVGLCGMTARKNKPYSKPPSTEDDLS
jgi:hypothetical protein